MMLRDCSQPPLSRVRSRMLILTALILYCFTSTVLGDTLTVPASGSVTATEEEGFILSPGYPRPYPNRVRGFVDFEIDGSQGKYLEISAVAFNVEGGEDECIDKLTFHLNVDGQTLNYGPRCGPSPVWFNKMLLETTDVTLRFTSDAVGRRSGFKLSYRVVDPPQPVSVQNFTCGEPKTEPCLPLPSNNSACARRIVNGDEALPNSYPWQIGMVKAEAPNDVACGGSLVHPCWIVTAAHCVRGEAAANIKVRVGAHTQSQKREVLPVSEIVMHPGYNITSLDYDIALLKLGRCVTFNDTVRPVCVTNPSDADVVGMPVVATGWGALEEEGNQPDRLQEVQLRVVTKLRCQQLNPGTRITERMICAGAYQKDTCQGDSGGPLVYRNPDKTYRLIGATSFGDGCARTNRVGVYADIRNLYDWVSRYVSNI